MRVVRPLRSSFSIGSLLIFAGFFLGVMVTCVAVRAAISREAWEIGSVVLVAFVSGFVSAGLAFRKKGGGGA